MFGLYWHWAKWLMLPLCYSPTLLEDTPLIWLFWFPPLKLQQKLAKREAGAIDRSRDIVRLQEFYKSYREKNNVVKLREEEMKLRESAAYSAKLGELERKTVKRKRVFATLKVLRSVLEQLDKDIPEELQRMMDADAAMTEDLIAYNIIPLDGLSTTNAIVTFPEVRAAMEALRFRDLPTMPPDFQIPATRVADIFDFLHYVFGFQRDNVSNQREHVVHLLSNEQSMVFIPDDVDPRLDNNVVQRVFQKSLDNYIKWCIYLDIQPMAREMDEILRQQVAQRANSCNSENGASFLKEVITPLYEVVAAYRGLTESFCRSLRCFELSWPWRKNYSFFQKPKPRIKLLLKTGGDGSHRRGKTSFVEHRTFLHLYHSFHRLWLFLVMMFQGLVIIAFNNHKWNSKTIRELLSLGPTFVIMKFIESILDIVMMYGAYSTTRHMAIARILLRFLWFGAASGFISFLYVKALQEQNQSDSAVYRLYVIVIVIYASVQFFLSFLMRIPFCHHLTNQCDRWPAIRFLKWMRQERYYVGCDMYERNRDFLKYMIFWLVILGAKFSFAYFLQIKPLVEPTRVIVDQDRIQYSWHDFVSQNNHNALAVASLWSPVIAIYLLDIHVFYTVFSAIWGFLLGARDRLGEIRSLESVHRDFEQFPSAFMDSLHVPLPGRDKSRFRTQDVEASKMDAARFSPFWNEIVRNLREEDYISDLEMELLLMPKNSSKLRLVQWPLFLLASKIFLAKDIAIEHNESQDELWEKICRDDYMKYAVEECFSTIKYILQEILEGEGILWVARIYEDIEISIEKKNILGDFQLNKLPLVISRVTALMGLLKEETPDSNKGAVKAVQDLYDVKEAETPDSNKGAVKAVQDLYDVVCHDVLSINMRENYETWNLLSKARNEGRLFSNLKWPKDPELKLQVKRLYSLLTIKDSAANVPKNLEARRRLEYFTNSLFMEMPPARAVQQMLSFRQYF
ncbi:hypothetical protein SAY86_025906 [Trapa natans]|uniref:1,3-beta-glucan synthase component FKS1-like domain-containing protein n=1 Tax=Trapa natans TaxID=22666 RepID=A0AAN7KDA5_TRANT|nr:hypothetical protein SAY86_025906 [Trapa natans]